MQLLVIIHVPAITAAALPVAGTVRLPAGGGGQQQLFSPAVDRGGSYLDDADLPFLARYGARHEHGAPADMANAEGLGGVTVNRYGMDFIFLKLFHSVHLITGVGF